jgi:HAD superfamily 5'-nucleotidase-like hydrolase
MSDNSAVNKKKSSGSRPAKTSPQPAPRKQNSPQRAADRSQQKSKPKPDVPKANAHLVMFPTAATGAQFGAPLSGALSALGDSVGRALGGRGFLSASSNETGGDETFEVSDENGNGNGNVDQMSLPTSSAPETENINPRHRIFPLSDVNMANIHAILLDMDYSAVQYDVREAEKAIFDRAKQKFSYLGPAVETLRFNPRQAILGNVVDPSRGVVLKANFRGIPKVGYKGYRKISPTRLSAMYQTRVQLRDPRWDMANSIYALTGLSMYSQLVHLKGQDRLTGNLDYRSLYDKVTHTINEVHQEGYPKSEFVKHPDRYVLLDSKASLALLDQYHSGKKLVLVTNSPKWYVDKMMSYSYDRYLPRGMRWRDLFNLVVVRAEKPGFFSNDTPFYTLGDDGEPSAPMTEEPKEGASYAHGNLDSLLRWLKIPPFKALYAGDDMRSEVLESSRAGLNTLLLMAQLSEEIEALQQSEDQQLELTLLMDDKNKKEDALSRIDRSIQRIEKRYGPQPELSLEQLRKDRQAQVSEIEALNGRINQLAKRLSHLHNEFFGPITQAGGQSSLWAEHMRRRADLVTSKLSNLASYGPNMYFRARRSELLQRPFGSIDEPVRHVGE